MQYLLKPKNMIRKVGINKIIEFTLIIIHVIDAQRSLGTCQWEINHYSSGEFSSWQRFCIFQENFLGIIFFSFNSEWEINHYWSGEFNSYSTVHYEDSAYFPAGTFKTNRVLRKFLVITFFLKQLQVWCLDAWFTLWRDYYLVQ